MLTEVLSDQNEEEYRGIDGTEGPSNALNEGSIGLDTCHCAIGHV
jgi:hypothetical protein